MQSTYEISFAQNYTSPTMLKVESRQDPVVAKQNLTLDVLNRLDDTTSNSIIQLFKSNKTFVDVSKTTTKEIIQRDNEDAEKLKKVAFNSLFHLLTDFVFFKGIQIAIDRKVLEPLKAPQKYIEVDVLGKSADEVAGVVLKDIEKENGCVVVLCGLSGTGKGDVFFR